jgi:TetR/AcrR family transcriptional repressor of nem operon
MPRPKAYDEDAMLSAAMHTFRIRGYGNTSIKDLEQATGLRSGSLYHSYRDKEGLFEAVLVHYNDTVVQARIDRHLPPGAGVTGLRRMFRSLLKEPDGGRHGCLLTNSAVELGGVEGTLRSGVDAGLNLLQAAFERVLAEARDAAEISPEVHPSSAAVRLLVLYQGLLVLIRGGRPDKELLPLIDTEFAALAWAPSSPSNTSRKSR